MVPVRIEVSYKGTTMNFRAEPETEWLVLTIMVLQKIDVPQQSRVLFKDGQIRPSRTMNVGDLLRLHDETILKLSIVR